MWNLKYDNMNISTKQKQTHREQACGCQGEVGGEGLEWEFGISRCKLLHGMDKQQSLTV